MTVLEGQAYGQLSALREMVDTGRCAPERKKKPVRCQKVLELTVPVRCFKSVFQGCVLVGTLLIV